MADHDRGSDPPEGESKGERKRFQRLGEQISGFLDPESALRRGQDLVTGVTQATKEELMRIVGAEVRGFLDKMDIADLAQQIVAGLVVDVHMTVRFSRDEAGQTQPKITRAEADVRSEDDKPAAGKKG
jgi:hypothetical protein